MEFPLFCISVSSAILLFSNHAKAYMALTVPFFSPRTHITHGYNTTKTEMVRSKIVQDNFNI